MASLAACVRRVTLATLTLAAACAATTTDGRAAGRGKMQIGNSSEALAQSLRRQLMKDNYDYMSTDGRSEESEHRFHIERNRSDEDVTEDKIIVATVIDGEVLNKHPRDKISSREEDENKNIAGKHKDRRNHFRRLKRKRKKIHKYLNDGDADVVQRYRWRHRYNVADDRSVADQQPPDDTQQASTVKYTFLKLRSPYRRSGQAAALIQEQSPQGVAVVKLGAGPFPEFRLPAPRRQYMSGPRPLRPLHPLRPLDDEELPPPPLDRPAPATPATSADTLNTIRQPEPYFDNEKNSFKITVTPDEIFVL